MAETSLARRCLNCEHFAAEQALGADRYTRHDIKNRRGLANLPSRARWYAKADVVHADNQAGKSRPRDGFSFLLCHATRLLLFLMPD